MEEMFVSYVFNLILIIINYFNSFYCLSILKNYVLGNKLSLTLCGAEILTTAPMYCSNT